MCRDVTGMHLKSLLAMITAALFKEAGIKLRQLLNATVTVEPRFHVAQRGGGARRR